MPLEGKQALITGSSLGIGRGIALALAESGVNVAVHYFQNQGAAIETLAAVRKRGSDGFLVQADVTRRDQIAEMFRKLRRSSKNWTFSSAMQGRRRPRFIKRLWILR